MYCKTEEEIKLMRKSGMLVSATLASLAALIKPGTTTLDLDKHANEFIRDHGAIPSFYKYNGFPFHICISVNNAVVHGCPDKTPLDYGDIVALDVGACLNGFHGDQAYTFIIGEAPEEILKLVDVTKSSLEKGIEKAIHGNRVGDIGFAIQSHIEPHGYGIVKDLVGHGLGKDLHEKPDVPNFGLRGRGKLLRENLVLAIEPMVNLGTARVFTGDDAWTIYTEDGKPAVHFEQDVCVKKDEPILLTDFGVIERAEKANINLNTLYY